MDHYTFKKDIPTYCVTAERFPEGIGAAHKELQALLPKIIVVITLVFPGQTKMELLFTKLQQKLWKEKVYPA
jgi:hypothetical protein